MDINTFITIVAKCPITDTNHRIRTRATSSTINPAIRLTTLSGRTSAHAGAIHTTRTSCRIRTISPNNTTPISTTIIIIACTTICICTGTKTTTSILSTNHITRATLVSAQPNTIRTGPSPCQLPHQRHHQHQKQINLRMRRRLKEGPGTRMERERRPRRQTKRKKKTMQTTRKNGKKKKKKGRVKAE